MKVISNMVKKMEMENTTGRKVIAIQDPGSIIKLQVMVHINGKMIDYMLETG